MEQEYAGKALVGFAQYFLRRTVNTHKKLHHRIAHAEAQEEKMAKCNAILYDLVVPISMHMP